MMCGPPVRSCRIFTSLRGHLFSHGIPLDLLHPHRLQNLDTALATVVEAESAITVAVLSAANLLHHHIAGRFSIANVSSEATPTPRESQHCYSPSRIPDGSDLRRGILLLNS